MCLDKDILFKLNRIYSPNTCCFTPEKINLLFCRRQNKRGDFPIGITYDKNYNQYRSQLNKNNKRISSGSFNTPEKAFQAYKKEKEKYIKEMADQYKDKIPQKLYEAMYKYEIEITD